MNQISIVPYTPELKIHFGRINKEWVTKYFTIEPFDMAQLDEPDRHIIDNGGVILFAKDGEEVIGTIGLIRADDEYSFELIKMGVVPEAQGKGVAQLLIMGIVEEARKKGADKIILYSSSKLIPALSLYKKMGFKEAVKECGKYARCDVKMELEL
ncbi:GNAT family N-acetyltransferase [Anditalea andensis]|uniref:MarR family transcriptional regulator n=1 Tax=Anditalea andensis TaxID=1048983 RepID=A0A074KV65_9BACT|nr:GNAT family N-acetyltransferase [Anditalea andensis]KEO72819.1 MarR family transcriptional regulator [Anditalea andensis]